MWHWDYFWSFIFQNLKHLIFFLALIQNGSWYWPGTVCYNMKSLCQNSTNIYGAPTHLSHCPESRGEVLRLLSNLNKFLQIHVLLMWLFLTKIVNQCKQSISSTLQSGSLSLSFKSELFGWLNWQVIFR